ncbi:TonB-dependent receptor [Phocaeicola faecalis]|jgi:TonB-linked SusC/RagA family outer membrane protein|uniref:SusC/RagA family TonB-linked outer membrane protein n=1 Tax=Phocaeicola faecalis TaxID=2786956 RepID=UPI001F27F8FE|nr:TonB-dependent receptor [Phocaeicola faecalis]
MRREQLKLVSAILLLSGFSTGFMQAAPHAAATGVSIVQQDNTCTGVVLDQNGESVIGASVVVKGTTNGGITGIDGDFIISNVKKGDVIVISFVGYAEQQIVWDGKPMKVILKEDTETLDEVVVVGYGVQRKSSITGSIASVKSDKLKTVTTPSVANMLQGKVAGVVVTPTSGRPGAGVSIRVRGTGSLRGNTEPLWVIDGVVGDAMADLNPNDIESISILKDGSATALYGSRGANGVVQVVTKRATTGGSSFDASVKFGISQLQKGNLEMMNGAEYYDYLVTAYTNAGTLQDQQWLQPYLKEQNFDWWDFATQNALTQNYNIGYKYGNDRIKSYISADYYTEEGAIKGYDYDRFTLRVNTDYIVNDRLTLRAKLSTSYKETFDQQYGLSHTSYTPWDTPYDSQGNVKIGTEGRPSKEDAATADPRDYWYSDGSSNWLYNNRLNWGKSRSNAMDIGVGFDYKIFDWLTFVSNNKVGLSNSYGENYYDPMAVGQESLQGTIYNSNSNVRTIYTSQLLRFLKTFNDVHEINAYLGYDYDEYRYYSMTGQASQMFQGNEILNGGVANPKVGGTKVEKKNAAYYFNGNYSYDNKYLFQVMFRVDGSSQFGSNKRWAPFWSVGGGWSMHKEEFMSNLKWVNELKPRISYGISGNLPDGAYEWATMLASTTQYGSKVGLYSNYLGNPDLSWEETATLDFGLDVRLFDRLSIVFDYYHKDVKNLIYLKHLPAVTGYNRQTANNGKMTNQGFEVTVTPEIIRTKDLYWDVSFNLGYNKNEITYLPDGDELTSQATAVGYPYRNWYLREWAGVDSQTGTPLWFKVDEEGNKTVTGDYNQATRVLLDEVPTPKFNGAISTNLTWKGFTLNANFTFATGAKIYNGQRAGALDRDCGRNSQPPMKLKDGWSRWEKPGDIATHPQLIDGGNNGADRESTRYLENGDYFKLKSLSLAYSFPKRWLEPLGVKSANLSVGGENLFTITSFSGQDPEILYSSDYNGSAGSFGYPTVRRFTLGLSVQF